jgi:hypothetical protein
MQDLAVSNPTPVPNTVINDKLAHLSYPKSRQVAECEHEIIDVESLSPITPSGQGRNQLQNVRDIVLYSPMDDHHTALTCWHYTMSTCFLL